MRLFHGSTVTVKRPNIQKYGAQNETYIED